MRRWVDGRSNGQRRHHMHDAQGGSREKWSCRDRTRRDVVDGGPVRRRGAAVVDTTHEE